LVRLLSENKPEKYFRERLTVIISNQDVSVTFVDEIGLEMRPYEGFSLGNDVFP